MPHNFSALNVGLLAVTVLAVLFGGYGWFLAVQKDDAAPRPAALVGTDVDNDRPQPTRRDTGSSQGQTTGQAEPQQQEFQTHDGAPPVETVEQRGEIGRVHATVGTPSDRGNAEIKGTVLGPGGSPVGGITVICTRTDLQLDPPGFDGTDFDAFQRQAEDFLKRARSESRSTVSDREGKFRFSGLDPSLSYNLRAADGSGLSGESSRVAAGDTTVIFVVRGTGITGRVQNARGEPVTNFTIRHHALNRVWEARTQSFQSADGTFELNVRLGRLQLEVQASGYTPQTGIEVDAGPHAQEVVITLEQGAVLEGVVKDTAGNPLPNAEIGIGLPAPNNRSRWEQAWQQPRPTVRSDSQGRYRFDSLEPGETVVHARFGDITANQTVNLGRGTNKQDFTLEGGAIIRIRLASTDGTPLDADQVWMNTDRGNWARPQRLPAREPGLIELAGIQPGTYVLTLTVSGFPALRRDLEVTGAEAEFRFELSQGALLSGRVTCNAGSSLEGMTVRLRKEEEQRFGGWGTGRIARLDDAGMFRIGPAEPGSWMLELYREGNWTPVYSTTLELADGLNNHDVAVDSGATLSVTIRDEQGNPIGWADVRLRGEDNHTGRSDAQGIATISFITPGTYSLQATARGLAAPNINLTLTSGRNSHTIVLRTPNCARLTHVYPDTQAARIGLQAGDLVIEYNGNPVENYAAFTREIRRTNANEDITMRVERNGVSMSFQLRGGRLGIEGTDGVR